MREVLMWIFGAGMVISGIAFIIMTAMFAYTEWTKEV